MQPNSSVYFLRSGDDGGPIKIGYMAGHAFDRINVLQTGNPHLLHRLARIHAGTDVEQWLHRRLATSQLREEWFHPTADVLAAVAWARTWPAAQRATIPALVSALGDPNPVTWAAADGSLGAWLAAERRRRSLPRGQMAALLRIDGGTLQKLEDGRQRSVTPEVAARIASALDVTAEMILALGAGVPERPRLPQPTTAEVTGDWDVEGD